ncbi:hypothetical protein DYB34_005724 [Aphanomyces astaci]|uniref:F-box domain-containing protein n=1 Tax=Aphanomyces astaci TaxID=112090 RepID=A0A418BR76_APHAT|nr:hypothetical protein DYB34_005724 [Aphanomyces astaci]
MSAETLSNTFDDLTEVIHEMGSPERMEVPVLPSVDGVAVLPSADDNPIRAPVAAHTDETTPVDLPPPAPTATTVSKLFKVTSSSVSTRQIRKPLGKQQQQQSTEVIASKVNTTPPVTSRLARPSSLPKAPSTAEIKVKPAFFLARLPRAIYAPLFSYFPIDSLKSLSEVSPEMYHMVNSNYAHWSSTLRQPDDPTSDTLLADAMVKIQDARAAARDALVGLGDVPALIKVEDLRVLRTYRNPPPAVLRLSKALVQLLRFSPPKGAGVDARAAAGDWGVIKTQFLDLKTIIRALKTAADAVVHAPLSVARSHLDEIVALACGPDLDEIKFKRVCAALVPTLAVTRKIAAALNVELRALDVTLLYKRRATVSHADVGEIVAKLTTDHAQPEASPATSPTHAKAKRLVPKSTVVLKVGTAKAVAAAATPDKAPALVRKTTPRPVNAAPRPRLHVVASPATIAEHAASSSSNTSTPRASLSSARAVPKRTPLSARALPSRTSALAKRTSTLNPADGSSGVKKAVSATPSAATSSMASLRADLEAAAKELQSQAAALAAQTAHAAALAQTKGELESQLKQAQDDLADVKVQWGLSQNQVQTQLATLLEVKCVQETLQFRLSEMAAVDAARSAELDALALEKEQLQLEVRTAHALATQSRADADEKAHVLECAESTYAQREADLRESLRAAADADRAALVREMDELKVAMATLQAEHHAELEKKTHLGASLAQHNRFVTAVQAEKANLVSSLQAAQSTTYSLGQTVVQLQDDLAREKKRVAAAERNVSMGAWQLWGSKYSAVGDCRKQNT